MKDKELLELAAKAAGELTESWYGNAAYFDGLLTRWNPLTNDGDRYRLIKQLEIAVNFKYQYAEYEGICVCWPQDAEDDAYAIVMVAAEIGRMK